jgi:peptidoglycan hydrolase CwlO-like protein
MNQLSVLLALSVTGSVIVMILLLLVAGVIGFFTAWFYSKSIYNPIVKSLEDEKAELNKQILGLNDDVTNLNSKIDGLNNKVGKLEKKIAQKETEIKNHKNTN